MLYDSQIKTLKPTGKPYKKADSDGMYLYVSAKGAKIFRHNYKYGGKEKTLVYGPYPAITLTRARELVIETKRLLAENKDPQFEKTIAKQARASIPSFEQVAREWHGVQSAKWQAGHAANVLSRLEKDLFPALGKWPINQITTKQMLDTLRVIEARDACYLAGRARARARNIFQFGVIAGYCENNPADGLQGMLKTKKTQHFKAYDKKVIPALLKAIYTNDGNLEPRTRRAMLLSLLLFQRPKEMRMAKLADLDLEKGTWIIPASDMKMGLDHIIPLSKQAIAIIKVQLEETGHLKTQWLFPSQRGHAKPMSEGTVNCGLKRLKLTEASTAHGFRALARTTIREELKVDADVIERQLAHKPSGPLGAAYDRAQFQDERKIMMQRWADFIQQQAPEGMFDGK